MAPRRRPSLEVEARRLSGILLGSAGTRPGRRRGSDVAGKGLQAGDHALIAGPHVAAPRREKQGRIASNNLSCYGWTQRNLFHSKAVLMPTIRISEETYEHLKAHAEPFVDT